MKPAIHRLLFSLIVMTALTINSGCQQVSGNTQSKIEGQTRQDNVSADHTEKDTVQQDNNPADHSEKDAAKQEPELVVPSLQNLLKAAIQPVGSTMYIWGGGWNEEDTGAGSDAVTIGVSDEWKNFFDQQDGSYSHLNFLYDIHKGLDCSGFIGWAVYNMFNNENGNEGHVYNAYKIASQYAENGWGTYTPAQSIVDYKPGDILSSDTHVYLVLGQYEDGSVLFIHAAPPGVRLSGTPTYEGTESMASQKARELMAQYYPDFYHKFADCYLSDYSFLTDYDQFRWSDSVIPDAAAIQAMSPDKLLALLYPQN